MIKEKIFEVAKILEGYGQNILEAASNEEIEMFQKWVRNKYGEIDINEYIYLVKLANGIDFNGLVIYSLKNKLETSIYNSNDVWHENDNLKYYLFYADSDITWYCFDVKNKMFCELDKPTGEVIQTYKTFNDMLNEALNSVMQSIVKKIKNNSNIRSINLHHMIQTNDSAIAEVTQTFHQ